jgi:hypothetical protein
MRCAHWGDGLTHCGERKDELCRLVCIIVDAIIYLVLFDSKATDPKGNPIEIPFTALISDLRHRTKLAHPCMSLNITLNFF